MTGNSEENEFHFIEFTEVQFDASVNSKLDLVQPSNSRLRRGILIIYYHHIIWPTSPEIPLLSVPPLL